MSTRSVKAQHPALRDDIADLHTRRPLPGPRVAQIDPFLFLNHHGPQTYPPNNRGLPFGPHPHRGFETVTFILDGMLSHSDTGGHESVIHAGGVQWMTAGSGLVHSELSPEPFRLAGGSLEILQLWVNLPARFKMTPPRYVGLQKEEIPTFTVDDGRATVHLISGRWDDRAGPIETLTGVTMTTIAFAAGAHTRLPAPAPHNVFFYLVRGELAVNEQIVEAHRLVEFHDDGDGVDVEARQDSVIVFGYAEPLREPVVAHGPFVMNTQEEIAQAVRDYQAGLFDRALSG